MSAPYNDIEEEDSSENTNPETLLEGEELTDISLDDMEDEEGDTHQVRTYNPMDDGESYFDGAYFDE